MKVWNRAGVATPASTVKYTSVVKYVSDCSMWTSEGEPTKHNHRNIKNRINTLKWTNTAATALLGNNYHTQ